MKETTYTNGNGRKDVLHALSHFRQPLMFKSLPITGLTLEIWLVVVVLDISLVVGFRYDSSKAVTRVSDLIVGLSQEW